ncbi:MAG: hypothetical protein KAJ19_21420 [Gammaproteobacteria bacterium]|nr:hypothetical protein [Gammaproteobacteria bacterium]
MTKRKESTKVTAPKKTFRKVGAGHYTARHDGRAFELRRGREGTRRRQWKLREVSTPEHELEHGRLIDSSIATIAEGDRALGFVLAVDAHLQSLGATEDGPGLYVWVLETRLGPLYVDPGARHVFMRFKEVERAEVELGGPGNHNGFNPYSGKWNLHWGDGAPKDAMLHEFILRMERVQITEET